MMPRLARSPRVPTRPRRLDLSRKTSLVPRAGFWSRGVGLALRTGAVRLAVFLWRVAGFLFAGGTLALLLAGRLVPGALGRWELAVLASAALVLGHRLVRRSRRLSLAEGGPGAGRRLEQDLELALLSVTSVYVALALTGGLASPLYPALYLVLALLMVFHTPWVGVGAVAAALGVELALAWQGGHLVSRWPDVAAHGGFIVAFAVLYHLALAASVAAARRKASSAVEAHVRELHERARDYRLIVSQDAARKQEPQDQEKWLLAAVEEVDAAVRASLEVAEAALGTHTVAVYLLSADDRSLRLRECLSGSSRVAVHPLSAAEGLPAVVLRKRAPVRLCGSFKGASYYDGGEAPRSFLGVPLVEHRPGHDGEGWLRGIVVADRLEEEAFTDQDEQVLSIVAREVLRAIEIERVMGYIRKEKEEKARFHETLGSLNARSDLGGIAEEIVKAAASLVPQGAHALDLVAVTLATEDGDTGRWQHRVVGAAGAWAEALRGLAFEDNGGLVSKAVGVRASLPARDYHLMENTVVFTPAQRLKGLSTLKILPLLVGDKDDPEVLGTLVCGAKARSALGEELLLALDTLAQAAAGAVKRALLFEETERRATTDGLTGLSNHRRFQERLDDEIAKVRRYGRPVSLLLTDVDHFKGVNDTYGHPVGDKVLKGISRILKAEARDTDLPARYGGEEFTVILPETDLDGAKVIAERIRRKVEETTFQTELGPLKVTLSLGVATFPVHGDEKQEVIDAADQALYVAKRGGRNRVVCAERKPA